MQAIIESIKYWEEVNPILEAGAIGTVRETGEQKIGDGINNWSQLTYFPTTKKREYTVFLTQTETNDPDVDELEDTIGVSVTRSAVGTTLFVSPDGFPMDKTVPKKPADWTDPVTGNRYLTTHMDKDSCKLETFAAADTEVLADGVLSDFYFHLETYL
jgi:hypothetical protein